MSAIDIMGANPRFDRCIDLNMYNAAGVPIAFLWCLQNGPKPDITISGTYVPIATAISTTVTVTNLDPKCAINDVKYITAYLYYGNLRSDIPAVSSAIPGQYAFGKQCKELHLEVLFADQVQPAPDRQV